MVEPACTPSATTSYRDIAQRAFDRPVSEHVAKSPRGYRDAFVRLPSESRAQRMVAFAPACRM